MIKKGSAAWKGSLKDGTGTISTETGVLKNAPYGFKARFEDGPGNHWLVDTWARHASRPRGSSYAKEIYARLPNDTDFSILSRTGIPGLNFAPTGDSYAYHTARDIPDRLSPETIRQTGENIVSIVNALDRLDLERRDTEPAIYFDALERFAVSYPPCSIEARARESDDSMRSRRSRSFAI